MRKQIVFLACLLGGVLLLAGLISQIWTPPVVAGPLRAPTPIAATAGGKDWVMVTYLNTDTIDIDVNSGSKHTPAYSVIDLSYTIDVQSTYNNTATCYLDFSNDGTNWDRGLTVVSAVDDDATDMNQYPIFGRYTMITCTLSNTNEVTMTVMGKLHKN